MKKLKFIVMLVVTTLTFVACKDSNAEYMYSDVNAYESYIDSISNVGAQDISYRWDEIKMLYEALDARKNTVEKEGLTPEDNRKIAALKVKFAPMYTVNRIEEKIKENNDSKE